MKLELLYVTNYLVAINWGPIEDGDWYVSVGYERSNILKWKLEQVKYLHLYKSSHGYKAPKIVAYLPLDNEPPLEALPLLPALPIENNVGMLAWETKCLSRREIYELFNESVFKEKRLDGVYSISASKQVHEFNEKLRELSETNVKKVITSTLSEDDLRYVIRYALAHIDGSLIASDTQEKNVEDVCIDVLKQTKCPKWFVAEIDQKLEPINLKKKNLNSNIVSILKTTSNEQNQTVLSGNYEF